MVKQPPRYQKVWVPADLPEDQIDGAKWLPSSGLRVLPRRWGVERTFAWQSQSRRLSTDDELLCTTSAAFIYVGMIRLMVGRLTRLL